MTKHKIVKPPTPVIPAIECRVVAPPGAPPVLTVGDKRELRCKSAGTSLTNQSQIQFLSADKEHPYSIQFLGTPSVQGEDIVQQITSYHVGDNQLQDVYVKIDGKAFRSTSFELQVKSVLPPPQTQSGQAAQPTPFPAVDPMTMPAPWWWWAVWIALAVAALTFVTVKVLKWRKARAKKVTETVKELSPQEKFQARVRKLESQGFHLKGEYKRFALELTNIVKTAIGGQMKFPAEDHTTEELLATLQKKQRAFYEGAGKALESLLADLDRIKFAKIETTPQACELLLDQAMRVGRSLFGGQDGKKDSPS